MRGPWPALLAFWPLAGVAQEFPALYTVTGVAGDDVLNVRTAPDAAADVVATLPPDAANVEVLRLNDDGTWGWIGLAGGNGWAAMAYLIRQETDVGVIPRPLRCLGTEPFWSVMLGSAGNSYVTPEGSDPLNLVAEDVAAGGYLAVLQDPQGGLLSMTVARTLCSDGMSDRAYGFAAHVFRQRDSGNDFLTGCCMLVGE